MQNKYLMMTFNEKVCWLQICSRKKFFDYQRFFHQLECIQCKLCLIPQSLLVYNYFQVILGHCGF